MIRARTMVLYVATCLGLAIVPVRDAGGHPWHRHRGDEAAADATGGGHSQPEPAAASPRFLPASAPRRPVADGGDIGAAFAPFERLGAIATRRDERWFYVESDGIPDHPLMVGIRSWQQQVPLPQPYTGDNAWQIPLHPVRADEPATTRDRFLRGAIAVAVNGIPIFNPLNNRGEDAFAIGELDEYGGHCGRADDYHYHIAPVHLEQVVGKGRPIAFALDGYPVYGKTEPDGSPLRPLDELGGHDDGAGGYHYHALDKYPYLIGGFRGTVVERDGQVDPQPRARGVREALPPLRGATIVGFEATGPTARRLTYEIAGRRGEVAYTVAEDGSARFTFTDPAGKVSTESYTPRSRGPGGDGGPRGGGRGERGPPAVQGGPPRPEPQRVRPERLASREIAVMSPSFREGQPIPREFTCDGAGVSPPVEWQAGPAGTKAYALSLWHESPDGIKSYWVVHDIPASVRKLPRDSRAIGTTGLNGKHRAAYDPMCSKGPGLKTYHITVYALSTKPSLPAGGATRELLLEAIGKIVLAEGTLSFTYERDASP